ncbi:CPCC family cysteine-rich protein [Streptomyces spongiicola]|uniref:Hydrolase n=1 Tax=Streptomyces spongiicola TaxID=1690221 RepID=A0ABN5KRY0_9ACTN|nr:CPCC family cysteine-rich protein [Streptomyces spongiicola]AWK12914.1 hydrolase [Streptomyces spongiicola]
MNDVDPQILAELAELEALEAAEARGEPLVIPESSVAPPAEGWLPCPCCGHQMFGEHWSYEICAVCYWEDDLVQLRWPWSFGANAVCLVEAQRNYQRFGATEERVLKNVRPPAQDEPLDPGWRPIDPSRDSFEEPGSSGEWPEDPRALYWWRPTFWRRDEHPAPPSSPPES